MTADDVRKLIAYLEDQVRLADEARRSVTFELPDRACMLASGLHPDAVAQLLAAPWAREMAAEVRETPEFCGPDDSPRQVLRFARDVVGEYVRKRFHLAQSK
jgi:hypothetical protein